MILADPTDFVRTSSAVAEDWQDELRNAVRQPVELCRILRLPQQFEAAAVEASRQFPLFVPRGYIARMRPGDVRDPLLRQVLPLEEESADAAGFTRDPVGDLASKTESGIIQKYRSRVLTITTGACGVHCRYCFRRHFPYSTVPRGPDDWSAWISEIRRDASIDEVILSGGDPLTLVDSQLARLAEMIAGVPHVRRLRIHTRMPIVIPARVTREFMGWLTGLRVTPVLVVHANHAQELSADVQQSLTSLARRCRCARRAFPAIAGLPRPAVLPAPTGPSGRSGPFRGSGRTRDFVDRADARQVAGLRGASLRARGRWRSIETSASITTFRKRSRFR